MPFIRERPETEPFTISSKGAEVDKEYFVWDTIDPAVAENVVLLASPRIFRRLIRQNIKAVKAGPAEWFVTVHYSNIDPSQAAGTDPEEPGHAQEGQHLGPTFNFDTTGQTVHINQSIQTISKTTVANDGSDPNTALDPDNNLAIGVSQDRVEGTDIYAPQFTWSWEIRYPYMSPEYLICLFHLTARVNYDQVFWGFDKGEVLYLGATGKFTFDDQWVVTHKFSSLPNKKNFKVGNINVPLKRGWDYMWVGYQSQQVGNRILQIPAAVYVEKVYQSGDYQLLMGPKVLEDRLGDLPGNMDKTSNAVAAIVGNVVDPNPQP